MEYIYKSCSNVYEVEKIINCKIYKNKKYYLIKWLFYPISQSTWEPESNLKNLGYLIKEFETHYPSTIDQNMYNIFCDEIKRKNKVKNKNKSFINQNMNIKYLSKKRKNIFFSDDELNDPNLDSLKTHLYIKVDKNSFNDNKKKRQDLVIDLRYNNNEKSKNIINLFEKDTFVDSFKENKQNNTNGLIKPNML